MAINISQAFHRTSANPIDDTLALTKAEMLTVNDNLMPSKYLTVCQDDGMIYLYDKSATASAETGKFILFEAGGGGSAPIGTVIAFMGTTAPTNYVACDGTVYNISDYPKLANFFEQQFGTKNNFGGDGTTTFAVPNLNGEFLRGAGTNGHADQGDGASVGTHQGATAVALNYAQDSKAIQITGLGSGSAAGSVSEIDKQVTGTVRINTFTATSTAADTAARYAKVRPTNTSVLFCICTRTEETEQAGHEYSTTEQIVGTWVDGKPIYEKTIIGIQVPTLSATAIVQNVGALVDCKISYIRAGTIRESTFSFYNSSTDFFFALPCVNETTHDFYLYWKCSRAVSDFNIIVQYTKTTD